MRPTRTLTLWPCLSLGLVLVGHAATSVGCIDQTVYPSLPIGSGASDDGGQVDGDGGDDGSASDGSAEAGHD